MVTGAGIQLMGAARIGVVGRVELALQSAWFSNGLDSKGGRFTSMKPHRVWGAWQGWESWGRGQGADDDGGVLR